MRRASDRGFPMYMHLACFCAGGIKDAKLGYDYDARMDLRGCLMHLLARLQGELKDKKDPALAADREFWLDAWDFLAKHAPADDRLFQTFSKADLLAELDAEEAE